jgi:hypothetical protein
MQCGLGAHRPRRHAMTVAGAIFLAGLGPTNQFRDWPVDSHVP